MGKKKTLKAVSVRDYQMIMHVNMDYTSISKYVGTFECEGKPLHGKQFCKETTVQIIDFMMGEFGEEESVFYLNEDNSKMFDTIEELVLHYNRSKRKKRSN